MEAPAEQVPAQTPSNEPQEAPQDGLRGPIHSRRWFRVLSEFIQSLFGSQVGMLYAATICYALRGILPFQLGSLTIWSNWYIILSPEKHWGSHLWSAAQ